MLEESERSSFNLLTLLENSCFLSLLNSSKDSSLVDNLVHRDLTLLSSSSSLIQVSLDTSTSLEASVVTMLDSAAEISFSEIQPSNTSSSELLGMNPLEALRPEFPGSYLEYLELIREEFLGLNLAEFLELLWRRLLKLSRVELLLSKAALTGCKRYLPRFSDDWSVKLPPTLLFLTVNFRLKDIFLSLETALTLSRKSS